MADAMSRAGGISTTTNNKQQEDYNIQNNKLQAKLITCAVMNKYRFCIFSSVGIGAVYKLDGRGSSPSRSKRVFFLDNVQTSSGAYLAFYPIGTAGSFPGSNVAGA
jgi:hypothetical protein